MSARLGGRQTATTRAESPTDDGTGHALAHGGAGDGADGPHRKTRRTTEGRAGPPSHPTGETAAQEPPGKPAAANGGEGRSGRRPSEEIGDLAGKRGFLIPCFSGCI